MWFTVTGPLRLKEELKDNTKKYTLLVLSMKSLIHSVNLSTELLRSTPIPGTQRQYLTLRTNFRGLLVAFLKFKHM